MELAFSDAAKRELESLPAELKPVFLKHLEKILGMPPRRHLGYGIPYCVDNATKQARIIYKLEKDRIYILHCFRNHKEYERWYKSYR